MQAFEVLIGSPPEFAPPRVDPHPEEPLGFVRHEELEVDSEGKPVEFDGSNLLSGRGDARARARGGAGMYTRTDDRDAELPYDKEAWKGCETGTFMVFRADESNRDDVVYILKKEKANLDPSDADFNAENNGRSWHLQVRWYIFSPQDDLSGRVVPYNVTKALSKAFATGTQPEDSWAVDGDGNYVHPELHEGKLSFPFREFIDWSVWGPALLCSNLRLTAQKQLAKRDVSRLLKMNPWLEGDLQRRRDLVSSAAPSSKDTETSGTSCTVPV